MRSVPLEELIALDERCVLHGWSVQADYHSELVTDAQGLYVTTADGRTYMDFASQLGFANIGHGDRRIANGITDDVWNVASIYGSAKPPPLRLAKKLLSLLPDGYRRIFFGLNGSDAVEAATKIARLVTGRQEIVSFHYAYHGSSAGAASVGGLPINKVHEGVPGTVYAFPPYHYRSPVAGKDQAETDRNTVDLLRQTIEMTGPNHVAAVIGEPMMGSGVGVVPGPDYWRLVRALCDEYGLLLISDEVITGFGRTGHWFAVDYYDYRPDIIAFGKGITSGYLPLAATVLSERVSDQLEKRFLPHGLTNAHHAVCCAAALANIGVIEADDLISNAHDAGRHLGSRVQELAAAHDCVGDIRQGGLFSVVELVADPSRRTRFAEEATIENGKYGTGDIASQVRTAMRHRDVLITAYRSAGIVALVPPLPVQRDQIDTAIAHLSEVLSLVDAAM
jgi:taurine--2-oxoglutarate transaminase